MKFDIFNVDKFVEQNHCPEITNPIFFNSDTTPTEDGLFSETLFGFTDEDRKNIFGYIDLKGNYIHPLIWLLINKRMGSLGKVMSGEKSAVIADGKIKIVPSDFKGAETGIDFIYDHFNEINWFDELVDNEIDSIDKKTRLKFLKSLSKDEFFIRKWLVLPPFYRDVSSVNASAGDSINKLYKELISRVQGMNLGFSFDIFGSETRLRIQNIIKDLYLSTTSPISGKHLIFEKGKAEGELKGSAKNSMLRKHLLGKTIDWSSSSVITSPQDSSANSPKDMPVPFGYGGFPLAHLLSMFNPFYVSYCVDKLEEAISLVKEEIPNLKRIDLGQFNADRIQKMIKSFIKNPNGRFTPIAVEFIDNANKKQSLVLQIFEFKSREDAIKGKYTVKRPYTITDLFYNASLDICRDKHVYVTRHPVANYQNIYPSKIKVCTTTKTRKIFWATTAMVPEQYADMYIFEDEHYPSIPGVPGCKDVDCDFVDVTIIGNGHIKSLNADYDGDMVFMRAVFSQEANREASDLI